MVTGRRFYMRSRRAWTPRLWPIALGSGAFVLALALWLAPTAIEAAGIGVAVGVVVGVGRWEVWKWRHPAMTPAEFIDLRRRNARWN